MKLARTKRKISARFIDELDTQRRLGIPNMAQQTIGLQTPAFGKGLCGCSVRCKARPHDAVIDPSHPRHSAKGCDPAPSRPRKVSCAISTQPTLAGHNRQTTAATAPGIPAGGSFWKSAVRWKELPKLFALCRANPLDTDTSMVLTGGDISDLREGKVRPADLVGRCPT